MTENTTRYALVSMRVPDAEKIEPYLPANYRILGEREDGVVIAGTDNAGWTLDDYVIPRLGSGLIFAREITADEAGVCPDCGCETSDQPKVGNMITKQDAMAADRFHENHEPAGKIFEWRRNGATQTWVTRPDEFRLPVKYGMRGYGQITQSDAHNYHRADQCPTRHVRVRTPEGGEWFGIVIAEHRNPDGKLNGITRVQVTTKGALRGSRVGSQVDVGTKMVSDL